jgi:hypothetical protein
VEDSAADSVASVDGGGCSCRSCNWGSFSCLLLLVTLYRRLLPMLLRLLLQLPLQYLVLGAGCFFHHHMLLLLFLAGFGFLLSILVRLCATGCSAQAECAETRRLREAFVLCCAARGPAHRPPRDLSDMPWGRPQICVAAVSQKQCYSVLKHFEIKTI